MANFIYSKVTIFPQEAMDKICGLIENIPDLPFGQETKAVVETFYKEELEIDSNIISENKVDHFWVSNNIGTNWINISLEDDYIMVNSPSIIPDGFFVKLYSLCIKEFEDVQIYCKWWDETETQCGVSLTKDGFYTEHEAFMESESIYDTSYFPSGFEDIDLVKDWVNSNLDTDFQHEDINSMDENNLRDLFSDWKENEKWNTIYKNWGQMYDLCSDAIKNPYAETPILKIKKIATKKFEMIKDCYPFENY